MDARKAIWGKQPGSALTSTIDGFLKEDYVIDNIKDTINMSTYFLSRLRQEKSTGGREFRFPVRFGIGEGQMNIPEDGELPQAGFGDYDQARYTCRTQAGRLYITEEAIQATTKAAFASALKRAVKDCRDGFKLETYRQSWATERGTIARVNGAVTIGQAGDTDGVNTKHPHGVTPDGTPDTTTMHPYFRKNMRLVFMQGTGNSVRNTGQITGITDGGQLQVKFDSATNLVDGDDIIRGDSSTNNSRGQCYLGLLDTIKTSGVYLGLTRDNEPGWRANRLDANANNLTEDLLQRGFDMSEVEGNGMHSPNLLISNHQTRRLYQSLQTKYKRHTDVLNLRGGFDNIAFNNKPWVVDKLCPPEHVLYLTMEDWCWMVQADVQWFDRDGSYLSRVLNRLSTEGSLYAMRNIVCMLPANQTITEGVDTVVGA